MADFTKEQQTKIDYLRESVRLKTPDVETDPVYQFTDETLYHILETVTPLHSVYHTIEDIPKSEMYFVMLLARKEIYYRLATSTAPFYPLSAEGAKLEKNIRFDHYLALIKQVTKEYEDTMKRVGSVEEDDPTGTGGLLTVYNAKLRGQTYDKRFYDLSDTPYVDLELSGITPTSVNLDWTRYDSTHGSDFVRYYVYISTKPIHDEYSITPVDPSISPSFLVDNARRTKLRISDLEPSTKYYVLIRVDTLYGLTGYSQKSFNTESTVIV